MKILIRSDDHILRMLWINYKNIIKL